MKTTSEIESILRRAPTPQAPPQLACALKSAVELPATTNGSSRDLLGSLWRRWLPAIAYAILILGCVVVLAVQDSHKNALNRRNDELRRKIAIAQEKAVQRQQENAQAEDAARQIEQLKGNATEADQLALRLSELKAQIAALTAQAKDLKDQLAAVPQKQEVIAPFDFFGDPNSPLVKAHEKAMSISCVNNMKQIGLAARIWANDHDGVFPPNLVTLSNELSVVKVLCCPADTANFDLAKQLGKLPDHGWSRWPANGGSYDVFFSPGLSDKTPGIVQRVIARCRIHGNVLYGDGSVQMGPNPQHDRP